MRFVLILVSMVGCTIAGNVILKLGAVAGHDLHEEVTDLISFRTIRHLANWYIFLALGAFAMAFALYVVSLRYLPLNLVQSFATAQFVGTIIASALILSEPIGTLRWIGIALICIGMAVVARSTT